jgi:hypothetical protein
MASDCTVSLTRLRMTHTALKDCDPPLTCTHDESVSMQQANVAGLRQGAPIVILP